MLLKYRLIYFYFFGFSIFGYGILLVYDLDNNKIELLKNYYYIIYVEYIYNNELLIKKLS